MHPGLPETGVGKGALGKITGATTRNADSRVTVSTWWASKKNRQLQKKNGLEPRNHSSKPIQARARFW